MANIECQVYAICLKHCLKPIYIKIGAGKKNTLDYSLHFFTFKSQRLFDLNNLESTSIRFFLKLLENQRHTLVFISP